MPGDQGGGGGRGIEKSVSVLPGDYAKGCFFVFFRCVVLSVFRFFVAFLFHDFVRFFLEFMFSFHYFGIPRGE